MIFEINKTVSVKGIGDLRESVKWPRMEQSYKNPVMTSYCHIAVYENKQLVGYIDCVSNGLTDAYIQDLMVHPNCQQQGIGTELMKKMIAFLKDNNIYMISAIYGESELQPFYERFGFKTMLCGQLETHMPEK